MNPLTEKQIRASFINATQREAAQMRVRERLRSGLREATHDRDAVTLSALRRAIFYGLLDQHRSAGTRLFPS